jgi:hypothetical protein
MSAPPTSVDRKEARNGQEKEGIKKERRQISAFI